MRLRQISLRLLLPLIAVPIYAQSGATPANPLPPNAAAIPGNVKNAPFSANVITQYDRVLENGNHIHRETQGKVFRDSQGRVRTETAFASLTGAADKSQHITIQDPLSHLVIHLDPKTRTATIRHLNPTLAETKEPGKPGAMVLVAPQQQASSIGIPLQHSDPAKRPLVRTEALGTKSLEGVVVTGTRTARTIENGGNQPIISITEAWFSRDLQMVILSVTDDGQSAHSMMKLVDIRRGDPSPLMFQVPPDYTVKDTNPVTASVVH
jgi:hypothetical protein